VSDELPEHLESLLSGEAVWVEPSAELETRVRNLALDARAADARVWGPRTLLPVAVAVLVLAIGAFLASGRPDWKIDLLATSAAPEASAVVSGWNEREGTRLELEIAGLPAVAPDAYYEIWLTSPDGLHVSGGSFTGNGTVTAVVGVRRGDFPRIWITRELVDDDPAPSPETYFDTAP